MSIFKKGESVSRGQQVEEIFGNLLKAEGYPVRPANDRENYADHIDFVVNQNNKRINYEVKARKKINRSDADVQDKYVWIEIRTVSGRDGQAHNGWIFGAADYIAFEREKDFIVVDRLKLLDFVAAKCNLRRKAFKAEDALYKSYERWNWNNETERKEFRGEMTMIEMKDVESLHHRLILKQ
jgi:hypothetical protein